jgi:fructose-specific phosphotransferase system IIC component
MTLASDLPNVLAAESLLLTLITFGYGLAYPELADSAAIELAGRQVDDVGPDRARVRAARRRAAGLALIAAIVGAVFTPPAVHALVHFFERLPKGLDAFQHYNTIATTLVLVTLGCYLIACHAAWMVGGLTTALKRLSGR